MTKIKLKEKGRKAVNFIKEKASINPFTTGTFVLSSANLATNLSRKKSDSRYQEDQIKATKNLTSALTGVDKTIKNSALTPHEENNKNVKFLGLFSESGESNNMIKFRKKNFSILEDTLTGANIGATVGGLGSIMMPKKISKLLGKEPFQLNSRKERAEYYDKVNKYNSLKSGQKKLLAVAGGTIIGAALGALVGVVRNLDDLNSRRSITGDRLMSKVLDNLKKMSFKEGKDFTRDPKIANSLKTKVCIVMYRYSDDLRVIINTVSDSKLKDLTEKITRNIKNSSVINDKASNNYNEITISTISDGSADAGLISGICESFIHSGYPVYLVEVG